MNQKNTREIERKFLIKRLPVKLKRAKHYRILQGYLATEPDERHVRLRKKGKNVSLTFKRGRGHVRDEREVALTAKQFAALWPATGGRRLQKVRYEIPWQNFLIEIDTYRGKNKGLVVAEVEFPNHRTCRNFK